MNWKKHSTEYLNKHIYFTARKDICEMPDGRIVDPYFVVELPESVCAVAITQDEKIIMVKQYRHPIEETILELPGGFIDDGESAETAVARELREETGYVFTDYIYLGRVAANPGILNNFTSFYLATGGRKATEQQLDQQEDIEIKLYNIEEVRTMLVDNEIKQALHTACLFYAFNKLEGSKIIQP